MKFVYRMFDGYGYYNIPAETEEEAMLIFLKLDGTVPKSVCLIGVCLDSSENKERT